MIDDASDEVFWSAVRRAYPPQGKLLNLNNAGVSPAPLTVQERVIENYRICGKRSIAAACARRRSWLRWWIAMSQRLR
jgi:hypothetical protein